MMAALEQSNAPRALAASRSSWRWRLLLLYLAGVLQTRAQPDNNGFISIDCGLQGPSYVDDTTNLSHEPDAAFTDAGENHNISPSKIEQGLPRSMLSLRSFPNGKRNCYTLRSLTAGNKYLLRGSFKYGNYDGLLNPPVFDLHIGVNLWATVDTSGEASPWWEWEAILVVPDDFVQVCLVNTGAGNPFISGLDLRPLKSSLYPQVNAIQGLNLWTRRNFGPTMVRYPDDPYDRIWYRFGNTASWNITSTELRVEQGKTNDFEPPSKVMQTAVTPSVASDDIRFHWSLPPRPSDPSPRCMHILYFSELEVHRGKDDVREQYVYINGNLRNPKGFRPPYLVSDYIYSTKPFGGYDQNQFNVCIQATANSTLPPIINAYEVYTTMPTTNIGTDSRDISAITAIKKQYGVINENWVGDPCGPSNLRWGGLTCSPDSTSSHPRITGVNISFNGLKGDISPFFADLRAVQYMDLSHNNLTGSIPNTLSQLPSLKVLDLTGNQLSGSIPPGLIQKIQDGSLNLMSIS